MRARERIADEHIAELRERAREFRIVLFLALMKAKVLENGDVAIRQRLNRRFGGRANGVLAEFHGPPEQVLQRLCDGTKRQLRINALGPSEMRDHDDLRAAIAQRLEARNHAFETRRIGHLAVLDRHVEIGAHDHALSRDVDAVRSLQLVQIHALYRYL